MHLYYSYLSVTVEQFEFLHRTGSSHGESRIVRKSYPQEFYVKLAIEAYKLWDDIETESDTKLIATTGGLDFVSDSVKARTIADSLLKNGVEHKIMSPKECESQVSYFASS